MKYLSVLCLSLISSTLAASEEQGQSIMFKKEAEKKYEHLVTMPEKNDLGDKCQQMSRDIENLKGRPQRRYSLMQRYKQECELDR